jgi:hypothetical protein
MPQALLPIFPSDATAINEAMSFCQRDGSVYYFHGCVPVYTHPIGDLQAFRLWAGQLVVNGSCTQAEVVRAFGISSISMKRYVKKLRAGGAQAFFAARRTRRAPVLTPEVVTRAQTLLAEGQPRAAAAKTLALKPDPLNKAVRAGRLVEPPKKAPTRPARKAPATS